MPPPNDEFLLSPEYLRNLTGGIDFVTPLAHLDSAAASLALLSDLVSPVSLSLNVFVLASCVGILRRGASDRPALVFIAHNAGLSVVSVCVNALLVVGVVNPSLEDEPELPSKEKLNKRCSGEQGDKGNRCWAGSLVHDMGIQAFRLEVCPGCSKSWSRVSAIEETVKNARSHHDFALLRTSEAFDLRP